MFRSAGGVEQLAQLVALRHVSLVELGALPDDLGPALAALPALETAEVTLAAAAVPAPAPRLALWLSPLAAAPRLRSLRLAGAIPADPRGLAALPAFPACGGAGARGVV